MIVVLFLSEDMKSVRTRLFAVLELLKELTAQANDQKTGGYRNRREK